MAHFCSTPGSVRRRLWRAISGSEGLRVEPSKWRGKAWRRLPSSIICRRSVSRCLLPRARSRFTPAISRPHRNTPNCYSRDRWSIAWSFGICTGKSYALVLAHRKGATLGLSDAPYLHVETSRAGLLREQIATLCPSISDPRLFSEAEQQSGWCRPELLRVRGELLRASAEVTAQQAAESAFLLSLKLARKNGALFWEIKTAVSLAELWKTNRRRDARNVIEDVVSRIVDPYQTTDMRTARRLYEELR